MYRACVLVLIAMMVSVTGVCKCANRFVYVEGRINGPTAEDVEVIVQTIPDANWEPQPTIAVNRGSFEGRIYFDATKSEGRTRDNCSRVPKTVKVLLLKHGQQIDSIQLDISKEFVRDRSGDYKLRLPIEFHLR